MSDTENWVVGKGHAGLEESLPESSKRMAAEEDRTGTPIGAAARESAKAALHSVVKSVTTGSHEDRLVAAIIAATPMSGVEQVEIRRVADAAGVSLVFARFFLARKGLPALKAGGIDLIRQDATHLWVKRGAAVTASATVAPVTPGKRTRVKAKGGEVPTPDAVVPETPKEEPTAPTVNPDFFAFDPTVKAKIAAVLKTGAMNFWLVGETGCGKSEYYERILEEQGRTVDGLLFLKVSFNGESSVDDLLGHYTLRGGETVWVEGALPKAMKMGLPLICEEVDAAPAEANLAMQRALEHRAGKARRFYNPRNGEEVAAQDGFMILATANSTGGGDHTGLYAGVQVQNAAFRDRFSFERVTYPAPAVETEILIKRTGLDPYIAEKAVQFANEARHAQRNGHIFTPISTRTLLSFGGLYNAFVVGGMDKRAAIKEALLSAAIYKSGNPADEEALRGLIQRVFSVR